MSALPKSPIALSLETAIDFHPLTVTSQTLVLEAIALMHRQRDSCDLSESAQLESESDDRDLDRAIERQSSSYIFIC